MLKVVQNAMYIDIEMLKVKVAIFRQFQFFKLYGPKAKKMSLLYWKWFKNMDDLIHKTTFLKTSADIVHIAWMHFIYTKWQCLISCAYFKKSPCIWCLYVFPSLNIIGKLTSSSKSFFSIYTQSVAEIRETVPPHISYRTWHHFILWACFNNGPCIWSLSIS